MRMRVLSSLSIIEHKFIFVLRTIVSELSINNTHTGDDYGKTISHF